MFLVIGVNVFLGFFLVILIFVLVGIRFFVLVSGNDIFLRIMFILLNRFCILNFGNIVVILIVKIGYFALFVLILII